MGERGTSIAACLRERRLIMKSERNKDERLWKRGDVQ